MNSLNVFANTSNFLDAFNESGIELDSYLVGAISATEPLIHKREEAAVADSSYFGRITPEMEKKYRMNLLDASAADIERHSKNLASLEYATCVIGSTDAAEEDVLDGWNVWKL